jgi:Zn-dependent protease with chaperone function
VIGLVVVGWIAARVRRLTTRYEPALPGQHVDFESQPRLWALLDEVAEAAGGDDIDAVYLAPGAELAILERASVWAALRRRQPECSLVIGIGLFDGMTQLQLRSLLAHEYGHSAGGEFVFGVRRAVVDQCNGLGRAGLVALDPVWWLLRAFHRIFAGASAGAARRQELLADRSAVETYGTAAFVGAQRHVATCTARFPLAITAAVDGALKTRTPLPDLYQPPPVVSEAALANAVLAKLTEVPGDAHASTHERIAAAEALAITRESRPGDDEPVWALFDDRAELQRAMTAVIVDRLAAKGFALKAPA